MDTDLRIPVTSEQKALILEATSDEPEGMAAWARMVLLDAAKRKAANSRLVPARANESAPFAELAWSDVRHAGATAAITAAAVAGYERLGFLVTMALMLFALTAGVERKPVLHAALFSVGVTALTYALFTYALKSPLEPGILGFWQ